MNSVESNSASLSDFGALWFDSNFVDKETQSICLTPLYSYVVARDNMTFTWLCHMDQMSALDIDLFEVNEE